MEKKVIYGKAEFHLNLIHLVGQKLIKSKLDIEMDILVKYVECLKQNVI